MDIQKLHYKYFELYDELFEVRGVLPSKQYDLMAKALMDAYKTELKVTVGEWELANSLDLFKLKFDLSTRLPRRFLFWWNPIAKRLLRQFREDFKSALEEIYPTKKMDQSPSQAPETVTTALPTTLSESDSVEPTEVPPSNGLIET